ncbi:protein CMSS1-like [Glandiceps talaboti]
MADNLDDEWWQEDSTVTEEEQHENEEKDETEDPQKIKTKKTKLKRKVKEEYKENGNKKSSDGKQRKRRKITEELSNKTTVAATYHSFNAFINTECEKKLSVVERQDLNMKDEQFLLSNKNVDNLSSYLKEVIPNWTKLVSSEKYKRTNSPIILVITSSAKRAVELNREAVEFKGKCKTVKLFAKHMKVEEQEKYLNEHKVHFGVGTPHRITTLLESKSLHLRYLKYIILDWNWRDIKSKRLIDIPDIKKVFLELLLKSLIPHVQTSKAKFGLF